MNKSEFLNLLSIKLDGLPQSEIKKTIDYYDEIICDRVEDGMTEEEAVNAVGNIEDVVQTVMYEQPLQNLIKASVTNKTGGSGKKILWIVLLFLGSPIWLSLAVALLSVMLSVYIVVWVMTGVVYVLAASFALSAVTSIIAGAVSFTMYPASTAICIIGMGLTCASFALLTGVSCRPVTKFSIYLSKLGVHAVKSVFIK